VDFECYKYNIASHISLYEIFCSMAVPERGGVTRNFVMGPRGARDGAWEGALEGAQESPMGGPGAREGPVAQKGLGGIRAPARARGVC
jgi:hypothetical protein